MLFSCWPRRVMGATSTIISLWGAPGLNLGLLFCVRHYVTKVTDSGPGRGIAFVCWRPEMSVRGRGKAAGPQLAALLFVFIISK
jgi:hypothetical protein